MTAISLSMGMTAHAETVDPSSFYGDITPLANPPAELLSFEDPELSDTDFIQALVDMTEPGGTCYIPEGEYEVSGIGICRPMTLRSDGLAVLHPAYFSTYEFHDGDQAVNEQNYVFAVWSDDVEIEGLKFDSSTQPGSVDIIHYTGDKLAIRNNVFIIGENGAGILSKAAAKSYVVENNLFSATPGKRTFPMIQIGASTEGAVIRNNTLEGDSPDLLSEDFLSNFLKIESDGSLIDGNEFTYIGNSGELSEFEDEESKMAFAGVTTEEIGRLNPWNRSYSAKANPQTGDGITLQIALVGACLAQMAFLARVIAMRRKSLKSDKF
jgi:hypothetical protein